MVLPLERGGSSAVGRGRAGQANKWRKIKTTKKNVGLYKKTQMLLHSCNITASLISG